MARGLVLALFASVAVVAAPSAPVAAAGNLGTCGESEFRSAVAAGGTVTWSVGCVVQLTSAISIPAGLDVTIDGGGATPFANRVALDAQNVGRHFVVTGGTLRLKGINLRNARQQGTAGTVGTSGGTQQAADPGAAGTTPGTMLCPASGDAANNGTNGGTGSPGAGGAGSTNGGRGGNVEGGSILVSSGTVTMTTASISNTTAIGGNGGNGGIGGTGGIGGAGGNGGDGQQGFIELLPPQRKCTNGGSGASGGDGAGGGHAAAGAEGGSGGSVLGGVISNHGSLTLTDTQISGVTVRGGVGGRGGAGGAGGTGGAGGAGGTGGGGASSFGGKGGAALNGGAGSEGGKGGHGGDGGFGGVVFGGLIHSEGTLSITGKLFNDTPTIEGGKGGDGGVGGFGGAGGAGGASGQGGGGVSDSDGRTFPGGNSGTGGPGGPGGASGEGGFGGDGGEVQGAGINNFGTFTGTDLYVLAWAKGGPGGEGALAGAGGTGGAGGPGRPGGSASASSTPGTSGQQAGAGGIGGAGGVGGPTGVSGSGGTGGRVRGAGIASGGAATVSGTGSILNGISFGGPGGGAGPAMNGGFGGVGGASGVAGQSGSGTATGTPDGTGGSGAPGASGGAGGAGGEAGSTAGAGDGGAGGAATGGAVEVLIGGSFTMSDGTVQGSARGGAGTTGTDSYSGGGIGGAGAASSGGGAGGNGASGPGGDGSGGNGGAAPAAGFAGKGGNGGEGSGGGSGGNAAGGAIFATGSLTLLRTAITGSALGGNGGNGREGGGGGMGGKGGSGGWGGPGGSGGVNGGAGSSSPGGLGGAGGQGGLGGRGGDGGSAVGGGLYLASSTWKLTSTPITSSYARGGDASFAGNGGDSTSGGAGGDGGNGNSPGAGTQTKPGSAGSNGGKGGAAGAAGAGGSPGNGGGGHGGGVFAEHAPTTYTGVTYSSNSVVGGAAAPVGCAGSGYACGGAGLPGGAGGAGGAGGTGYVTASDPPGTPIPNGDPGSPGAAGASSDNGVAGSTLALAGFTDAPDCSAPTVCESNAVPVAVADAYDTPPGTLLSVSASSGVLKNDTDANGQALTATLVTNVAHGTLIFSSSGAFTYEPTSGFKGTDTFTYKASDGIAFSAPATVTIQVDRRPIVNPEVVPKVQAGGPFTLAAPGLLANDTDPDGDALTAVKASNPAHGTVVVNANGSFTYTPTAGYRGLDSFTYKASDGQLLSLAMTVGLTVNGKPVTVADSFSTPKNTTLVVADAAGVLKNDTDADGDPLTATVVTTTTHGILTLGAKGSINYVPVTGYTGPDSFTYKVNDGTEDSSTATVTLTITSTAPYAPFTSWSAFVKRQYTDLTAVQPTSSALSTWVSALTGGTKTKGDLIAALRVTTDNTSKVDSTVRLYRALLGRAPDAGGLKFWVTRRRSGDWTLNRMADYFASSSEFKRKYGSLTNRQFVTRIYTDVLGRAADTAGVNYWTGKLDRKEKTRGAVMVGFSESSEYKRKQAENTDLAVAYIYLLGRVPTAAETTDWVTRQKAGTTLAVLATELLNSAGYATHITG